MSNSPAGGHAPARAAESGPSAVSSGFRYIPQIDAMRALAVVSVMIYHLHPGWLPGGFSGVDVFFVISGYVVSASMAEQRADGFAGFAIQFYAKRIRRIVPALLACLIVTSLLTTLFVPQSWLSDSSQRTALFAFFGVSNFALMQADDYFAPRAEFNSFTHTWSLGVEEQFYLVFPVLFYAWLRLRDCQGFRGYLAAGLLPLFLLASVAFSSVTSAGSPTVAFYSLPSRFWELGAGALLFQLHSGGRALVRNPAIQSGVLAASIALIVVGFVAARVQPFPVPWALYAVAGTLGVIACVAGGQAGNTILGRLMAHPAPVFVGKISYSLYLWHWPVYVLFRWTTGLEGWRVQLLAALITVGLALVSYYKLENAFRQSVSMRRGSPRRIVGMGLAAVAGSCAFTFGVFLLQPHLSLSVTRDRDVWYPSDRAPRSVGGPETCRSTRTRTDIDGTQLTVFSKAECVPARKGRSLFVAGDSHATAYLKLLRKLSDEKDIDVLLYTTAGCSFISLSYPLDRSPARCQKFAKTAVRDIVRRAKPGDTVFLPSLRLKRLADQWGLLAAGSAVGATADTEALLNREVALQDAHRLLDPFIAAGLHVVFEAPTPIFKAPPFRCSDWFNAANPVCAPGLTMSRAVLQGYRKPILDALTSLRSTYSSVGVWDPFDILCPGETCRAFESDGPLFFDADHLSGHGNLVLYESFVAEMRRQGML